MSILDNYYWEWKSIREKITELEQENRKLKEENKKLKESLDIATKCSSKEEDWIIRLSEENKNLKSELSKFSEAYKKYS